MLRGAGGRRCRGGGCCRSWTTGPPRRMTVRNGRARGEEAAPLPLSRPCVAGADEPVLQE